MVEAAHDGEADGEAGGPAQEDDHLGGRGVVPVLAVQDRGGHREEPGRCTYLWYKHLVVLTLIQPVHADGDEVEDGGGGAHHVRSQVQVTHRIRQVPLSPVGLNINICHSM